MVIQHNISAVNSYRNLSTNQSALSKNLEKLSSGYRINRAGDDAAGLAISESMRSKINGLDQATSNANDAIGMIQTEEGALTEVHSMLQRMTTLATQAANGTYSETEGEGKTARENIKAEMDELTEEITRIANNTSYNGLKPLTNSTEVTLQIGPTGGETITISGREMTAEALLTTSATTTTGNATTPSTSAATPLAGTEKMKEIKPDSFDKLTEAADFKSGTVDASALKTAAADPTNGEKALTEYLTTAGISKLNSDDKVPQTVTPASGTTASTTGTTSTTAATGKIGFGQKAMTVAGANEAITTISDAINKVSSYRAELGAKQNRLEHTINNLKVTSENVTAAESRIRDTDMAKEIASYTKNNVLQQAAQSMLAQANQSPQGVLSLLQ